MHPLHALAAEVVGCVHCSRLVAHCRRIGEQKRRAFRDEPYWARPVPSFGDPDAGIVIVGLAPAAHGANRTGRMFTGDRSGQWLYRALYKSGLANMPASQTRDDGLTLSGVYITAAAHCAPPDNKPTGAELEACSPYLVRELQYFLAETGELARPLVVVALGRIAFNAALRCLHAIGVTIPSPRPQFCHLAEHGLDDRCTLLASYHPSQQNTQTGRLTESMFDNVFRRARLIRNGA